MKNLVKLILPFALAFGNVQNMQNSEYDKIYIKDCLRQKEISFQNKKEFYEKTIKGLFLKLDSIKYTNDIRQWGVRDFWQTPKETDSLMMGDCEDKAIFTYDNLSKKGLDLELVLGYLCSKNYSPHMWNEYHIGDSSYIIETSRRKGCIIRWKDTLDLITRYKPFYLNFHHQNVIKDFEDYSGMKLKFSNPKAPR